LRRRTQSAFSLSGYPGSQCTRRGHGCESMQFRCLLRRQFLLGQIDALGDEAVPSVVSDARQLPLAQIPERESRALRACSRSSVPDRAGSFSTKCGRSPRGSALSTRSEPQSTVSQCIEQRAAPIVWRRVSENGDAPNSIPCVIVRPFQGECVRLWFSSRTPSHGKSARSRKYPNCTRSRVALPSRCPDRDFVLASDPVHVRPVF